jgi:uncharacterized membrane protein SirB2
MTDQGLARTRGALAGVSLGASAVGFCLALLAGVLELNDTGTSFGSQFNRAVSVGWLAVLATIIAIVLSGAALSRKRSRLSIAGLIVALGALPLAFVVYMILLLAEVCVPGSCRP